MTDPAPQDDSWDELARELGLEKSSPTTGRQPLPEPVAEPTPPESDPVPEPVPEDRQARGHRRRQEPVTEQASLFDTEPEPAANEAEFDSDESEEGDSEPADGEPASGDGTGEDGQPGTGRKRRRRRRRRKKGGPTSPEAAAGPVEAAEVEEPDEPVVPHPVITAPVVTPVVAERYEPEATDTDVDEDEPGAIPLAAEEDTGGEVLRELIATWNVPAWDEIVSGLYRPER